MRCSDRMPNMTSHQVSFLNIYSFLTSELVVFTYYIEALQKEVNEVRHNWKHWKLGELFWVSCEWEANHWESGAKPLLHQTLDIMWTIIVLNYLCYSSKHKLHRSTSILNPHQIMFFIKYCGMIQICAHKLTWIDGEVAISDGEVAASGAVEDILKWVVVRWEWTTWHMLKCVHMNFGQKPKWMWSTSIFIHVSNKSTLYPVFGVVVSRVHNSNATMPFISEPKTWTISVVK